MDLLYQDFEMPEYLPETIDEHSILLSEMITNNPVNNKEEYPIKESETSLEENNVEDLFSTTNEDDIIENILLTLSERSNKKDVLSTEQLNSRGSEILHNNDTKDQTKLSREETFGSSYQAKSTNLEPENVTKQDQIFPTEFFLADDAIVLENKGNGPSREINKQDDIIDISTHTEEQLAARKVQNISDKSCQIKDPGFAINSLPDTLMIKATWKNDNTGQPYIDVIGTFAKECIPVGTRFGPLVGKKYEADEEPTDKSNCWKVFDGDRMHILDLKDESEANWMKYVKPAYNSSSQNLVAYQEGKDVYFLTIKSVNVDEELTFWFCKEYSERLKCPPSGDLMMIRIKQQQQLQMQQQWMQLQHQQQLQQQQQLLHQRQPWQQQQWQQQQQIATGSRDSASPDSGYNGSPPPENAVSKKRNERVAEVLYGESIDNPNRKHRVTLVLHHSKNVSSQQVNPHSIAQNEENGELPKDSAEQEVKNKERMTENIVRKTSNYSHKKVDAKGDREYTCKDCGKVFKQLSNLDTHMRIHSGQRPFKCDICDKGFTQKAHKEKHLLIHTGERPYDCSWPGCEKKFSSSSNLKTHEKIHEGKKDFVCDICSLAFSQAVHLKQHIGIHYNDRPYVCQPCGKEYISESALKTHKRKKNCGEVKQLDQLQQQKLQQRLLQQWQQQQQHQEQQQWQQLQWQQQQFKQEVC